MKEVAGKAGRELKEMASATFICKSSFVLLQSRHGGRAEIGNRGNVLTTVGGERGVACKGNTTKLCEGGGRRGS
jgi:hypothetical protein